VKEKTVNISASINGFFKKGKANLTGDFNFSELVVHSGDVHEMNGLSDLDLEEQCVGKYYKSNRDHILRFFVNENDYVKEKVRHFVIQDIVTEESVFVDGLPLIPFTGRILLKISKPINFAPVHLVKENILQQNTGFFGGVRNVVSSPFRTIANNNFSNPIPVTTIKPMNEILALALGCIVLLGIIGSFLSIIGLPLYLSFIIPGLLFLSIFIHGLTKTLPFLEQKMSVRKPLLNVLGWILILANLANIIQFGISPSKLTGLVFGIILQLFSRTGKILRVFGWILLISLFVYDIRFQDDLFGKWDLEHDFSYSGKDLERIYKTDFDSSYVVTSDNDSIKVKYRKHEFNWKDNSKRNYTGIFKVRDDFYNITRFKRENLNASKVSSSAYWRHVYKNLLVQNASYLNEIIAEYKRIISSKNLDEKEAADMIVTSIQNIPYCLVHDLSHRDADKEFGGFVSEWHQKGGACLELIKFGLQSPTEFMGNFMGDCDTRSVMLYHVLTSLGYNVVILTSERYGHAIIGISGNYRGKSKYYEDLKYYVWETTYPGYEPGVLSDEYGNMRYWNVVL
jgi:hypothetical protein